MFAYAKPVWAAGMEWETGLFLRFTFHLPKADKKCQLRLTASTAFHLLVNDEFIAYGPARAGDGAFRVEAHDCTALLSMADNVVEILVAGYNLSSYEYTNHFSFLCCETLVGEAVVFATGRDAVLCHAVTEKLRFIERYSNQRVLAEVYDLARVQEEALPVAVLPAPVFWPRRAPLCENHILAPVEICEAGTVRRVDSGLPEDFRLFERINSPACPRFAKLDCHLHRERMELFCEPGEMADGALSAGMYRGFRWASNSTGLLSLSFTAEADCELYILFDELPLSGETAWKRMTLSLNCVKISAPAGEHVLRTFEPYTMQFARICVTQGTLSALAISLVEIAYPALPAHTYADENLTLLDCAAVNTFRQNATDVFMDCPSRERAGWLCDSFFTARSEWTFTGRADVEHSFLENFLCPASYHADPPLPVGMLPMCYPSSHDYLSGERDNPQNYIPNWAMWLVLELEDFAVNRHGDPALIRAFQPRVEALLRHFAAFENEDGLLEDLRGWVFLEWSRASDPDLICGVNYPTNMLYAAMLAAAGRLYGVERLTTRAEGVRSVIRKQSFDGRFFTDNAVRRDGVLVSTGISTEACQYYAFFTETATPALHPVLFDTLMTEFGPARAQTDKFPEVAAANAFIGNYLRLEILFCTGRHEQLAAEMAAYFTDMARQTGTLWENMTPSASCNHGFASYVGCLLRKTKI